MTNKIILVITASLLLILIVSFTRWRYEQTAEVYSKWSIADPINNVSRVYVVVKHNHVEKLMLESVDDSIHKLEVMDIRTVKKKNDAERMKQLQDTSGSEKR